MSGWIKVEKDLLTDPRILRMAKRLADESVTQVRCNDRMAVTLLVGSLTQLWVYADTHIREDDTLDLGADEIDEFLGVPGFCQLMPEDWLQVLDEHHVKLPGFQTHNGTEAKKKALTQKRVELHRIRNVTQQRNNTSAPCNAHALPDQTRLDQTIRESEGAHSAPPTTTVRAKRAPGTGTRLPDDFALTPDRRQVAATERLDPERTFAKFVDYWRAASGSKARKHDWDATWRNWCRSEVDRNRPRVNGAPTPLVPKPPPTPEQVSEAHAEAARKNREQVERVLPNLRVAP